MGIFTLIHHFEVNFYTRSLSPGTSVDNFYQVIKLENIVQVKVAMATCGIASGSKTIMEFFLEQLDRRNIEGVVTQTGCMGYCYAEPTIEVKLPGQDPVVFGFVDLKRADQIIEKYIKTGELVDGIIPVNYQTIDLKE